MARLEFRIITIAVLAGLLMMLPACSSKDKEAKKPQTSSQQKAKAPEEMKSIVSDLEMIISELEKKIEAEKASALQQNTKLITQTQQEQQNQQGQGQSQQGQQGQQGQSGQSQQSSSGDQSQAGQQNQMSAWQKEDTSIKNIHRNWNALEPEAIKSGLSTTDRDSFEQALEKLTLAIGKQKKEDSLSAAIEVYGQYANLVKTFTTTVPAEFYQLKYEVMAAVDQAMKKEWMAAQEHIPKIQESWTNLKVKAESKDGKSIDRTEFSIHDLEQALKSEEPDLLMIKAEIVMSNLQKMQKELYKSSGGA